MIPYRLGGVKVQFSAISQQFFRAVTLFLRSCRANALEHFQRDDLSGGSRATLWNGRNSIELRGRRRAQIVHINFRGGGEDIFLPRGGIYFYKTRTVLSRPRAGQDSDQTSLQIREVIARSKAHRVWSDIHAEVDGSGFGARYPG